MPIYCVVKEAQPNPAVPLAAGNALQNTPVIALMANELETDDNHGPILFAVRSENEAKCLAIANAIVDVHNIWIQHVPGHQVSPGNNIRSYGCWEPDIDPPDDAAYVYVYSSASELDRFRHNGVFYIGEGSGNRWLSHVRDAHVYDDAAAIADPLEAPKLRRIRQVFANAQLAHLTLAEQQSWAIQHLVRRVASFNGEYALEKKKAVENFLINYWIGVFDLANKNRGGTQSGSALEKIEWISAPCLVVNDPSWVEKLYRFNNQEKITQGYKINLLKDELNKFFSAKPWTPGVINVSSSTRLVPDPGSMFESNGTDAFFNYTIIKDNQDYLKLHLKMGSKDLGARINIRALRGDHEDFPRKIANVFFNGDLNIANVYVKDPGPETYFKPCGRPIEGRNTVDTPFDLRDFTVPSTIQAGAPLLFGGDSRRVSLNEALQMIVNAVDAAHHL